MQIDLAAMGNRIVSERKRNGLTQEELAEKMNVSIQMISNLERGNKAIKINNLLSLAQILGVSTDYILTGKTGFSQSSLLCNKISNLSSKDYFIVESIVNRLSND